MASLVGKHDFHAWQNANFTRTLTYKDENGAAIDVSGYNAKMQIGRTLVVLTNGNGLTLNADGTIVIAITSAQIDNLVGSKITEYSYDLRFEYERPLIEGAFFVHPVVTTF